MLEMYERLGEQAGELLVFSLRPFLRLADPTPQPYSATRRQARGSANPGHGTNACSTLWLQGTKRSGSRQKLAGHAWIGQTLRVLGNALAATALCAQIVPGAILRRDRAMSLRCNDFRSRRSVDQLIGPAAL